MDFRQLQALIAIADHGSFSAAAAALQTVQSNVSSHVARLERELGVQLVDRHGGRLTEEGQAVVERGRRVAAELEAAVADVAALRHEVVGTARIGMIGTTARWLAPLLLDGMGSGPSQGPPGHRRRHLGHPGAAPGVGLARCRRRQHAAEQPGPGRTAAVRRGPGAGGPERHPLAEPGQGPAHGAGRLRAAAAGARARCSGPRSTPPAGPPACRLRPRAELDGVRLIASLTLQGYGPAILPATGVGEA